MLCKNHVRNGFENPFFRKRMGLKLMPGILSTNNPVSKVSGLRPSTFETGLLVLLFSDHDQLFEVLKTMKPPILIWGYLTDKSGISLFITPSAGGTRFYK